MGGAIRPFHNQPKIVAVDAVALGTTMRIAIMANSKKGRRKRPIKTGLEIPVKPISDEEIQKTLDQLAEDSLKKRTLPKMKTPPRPRMVARPVVRPTLSPVKGLLHPEEPKAKGFMGLLSTTPEGGKV